MTRRNNTGRLMRDSTTTGDEAFWPQYIILTQSRIGEQGANVSAHWLESRQKGRS